jgi:glycerol-3-phosphate O-acyltransferase
MLDHPEASADLTLKALPPNTLTREQILRRFELQKSYLQPNPSSQLQVMEADRLEHILAALLQMGKVAIE